MMGLKEIAPRSSGTVTAHNTDRSGLKAPAGVPPSMTCGDEEYPAFAPRSRNSLFAPVWTRSGVSANSPLGGRNGEIIE